MEPVEAADRDYERGLTLYRSLTPRTLQCPMQLIGLSEHRQFRPSRLGLPRRRRLRPHLPPFPPRTHLPLAPPRRPRLSRGPRASLASVVLSLTTSSLCTHTCCRDDRVIKPLPSLSWTRAHSLPIPSNITLVPHTHVKKRPGLGRWRRRTWRGGPPNVVSGTKATNGVIGRITKGWKVTKTGRASLPK